MITLTESAAEKILDLFKEQESEGASLRVFVKGDDNGQPAYGMAIEPDPNDEDEVIESFGVKVVVDEDSLPWVIGSEIDFIDSLETTGFTIRNPNMGGACGCGGGGACGCGGGAQAGACACGGSGAGACACGHETADAEAEHAHAH